MMIPGFRKETVLESILTEPVGCGQALMEMIGAGAAAPETSFFKKADAADPFHFCRYQLPDPFKQGVAQPDGVYPIPADIAHDKILFNAFNPAKRDIPVFNNTQYIGDGTFGMVPVHNIGKG